MPPTPSFAERILRRLHLLPTPVMDAFGSMIFARALGIGVRRGMFEAIALRPLTAEEVADETGLSVKGASLLAEAFVAGGYLLRRDGVYTTGAEARRWLLRSSETYLGDLVAYFESLQSRLGGLEYSLDHGGPREPYYASFNEDDWETYVRGMANLARLLLPDVLGRVRLPPRGARLLDLGGSHGLYAIGCCRKYPGTSAVVMDFAPALRAAASVSRGGMEDGVTLLSGDMRTDSLPEGMDAVFMFNVVHGFDEETNRALIGRAARALRPGGRLYILDQMTGVRRASLLSEFIPLMVGLNLLNEIGGSTYSAGLIREWCAAAGTFTVTPLRFPGVTLIEASDWHRA